MDDRDSASRGLVLIGRSNIAAGTIIAPLGITMRTALFLLLTTALLIVMSAVQIIYGEQKTNAGQ